MILFCSLWIIEGKEKVEKTEHNDKIAVSKMFPVHDRVVKKGKGNINIFCVFTLPTCVPMKNTLQKNVGVVRQFRVLCKRHQR